MNAEELAVIKERVDKATEGKWTIAGRPPCVVDKPLGDDKKVIVYGMDSNQEGQRDNWNDLTFIAHARQDVPLLIAELELLNAKWKAQGDMIQKMHKTEKRLREALEFYANKDSYEVWREGLDPELECIHDVDFDSGHKARKALEGES